MGAYSTPGSNFPFSNRPIKILGKNSDVDDTLEDLWEPGGTYVFPPAGGIQMRVVSTSANDTAAGTGSRQIELHYLDANYAEHDEHIILNGTTPVSTVATNIFRVLGCHSIAVGSGGVAAGNISIQNTAGTVTYGYISAGVNTMLQAIFTVPAGKKMYIFGWDGGSGTAAGGRWTEFLLRATAHDDEGTIEWLSGVFHIWDIKNIQDAQFNKPYALPIIFPEKVDIKISVRSDTSIANAICAAGIDTCLINANF